jgi:hypothetical protein
MLSFLLLQCVVTTNVLSRLKIKRSTCYIRHFHLHFFHISWNKFYSVYLWSPISKKNLRNFSDAVWRTQLPLKVFLLTYFDAEDSRLLECDVVLLGEHFPTFRKIAVPGFIILHSGTHYSLAPLFPCIAWPWWWRH